jgi:hypothetical protein
VRATEVSWRVDHSVKCPVAFRSRKGSEGLFLFEVPLRREHYGTQRQRQARREETPRREAQPEVGRRHEASRNQEEPQTVMASTPMPQPPSPPPQPGGGGGASGPAPGGQSGNPAFAIFAQITRMAQQMASAMPPTSPMAEEIQNQVRLALQKVIQSQAPQQQAPPI